MNDEANSMLKSVGPAKANLTPLAASEPHPAAFKRPAR